MSAATMARRREMIAKGEVVKQDERKKIRAMYDAGRNIYVKATTEHVRLLEQQGHEKVTLDEYESNGKGIVAGWHMDGSLDGCKNKEERDAVIERMKMVNDDYRPLAQAAVNTRRRLAGLEGDIEKAKTEARMARLDMEMAIAETTALAGEDEPHYER